MLERVRVWWCSACACAYWHVYVCGCETGFGECGLRVGMGLSMWSCSRLRCRCVCDCSRGWMCVLLFTTAVKPRRRSSASPSPSIHGSASVYSETAPKLKLKCTWPRSERPSFPGVPTKESEPQPHRTLLAGARTGGHRRSLTADAITHQPRRRSTITGDIMPAGSSSSPEYVRNKLACLGFRCSPNCCREVYSRCCSSRRAEGLRL